VYVEKRGPLHAAQLIRIICVKVGQLFIRSCPGMSCGVRTADDTTRFGRQGPRSDVHRLRIAGTSGQLNESAAKEGNSD
jgi:hypothetical protein